MKKITLTLILALFIIAGMAQTTPDDVPYKRFPNVPPFKLLMLDSSNYFTKEKLAKKQPTMIMLFSPECDHCKHETEELIKNIDKFKKIQIVMATPMPFDKMKEFYSHYQLARFKNITMGRDISFMLPPFYGIRTLPFLAFYDKNGKLIDGFEGSLPIEKILEKFK